jgi:hypothetical protein
VFLDTYLHISFKNWTRDSTKGLLRNISKGPRLTIVHIVQICGEKLSADLSVVEEYKNKFQTILEENGHTPDQVYNCDETGLYYKMMPSKTLAGETENSAPGLKKNKERLTILACSNNSGRHKLRLMCIGKAKRPRTFKNWAVEVRPVYYRNKKSAWMNSFLFKEWFFKEFVPSARKFLKKIGLPQKAILVVDNAKCHLSEDELQSGDIKIHFLPPNVTAILQPMDQGVVENLKRNYRKYLLQYLLNEQNGGCTLLESIKKINLKEVIYWLADSWNHVKDSTIQKSWSKLIKLNRVAINENFQEDSANEVNDLHDQWRLVQGRHTGIVPPIQNGKNGRNKYY